MVDRNRLGNLWVILQFTCVGIALIPGEIHESGMILPLILALSGTILAVITLSYNRPGNFNIHPGPRPHGHLVRNGPYRLVRHPMYCALILVVSGASLYFNNPWNWLGLAGLVITLVFKADLEESWLVEHHPGYRDYQSVTARFIPGIF